MTRRVFLSFAADDLEAVKLFRAQARIATSDLEFFDHSVKEPFDSTNSEYIRRQIRELIRQTSVTICLMGESTWASKWVEWELITSISLGKGLLGVTLSDRAWFKPQPLIACQAKVVPWKHTEIVAAIEDAAHAVGKPKDIIIGL